MIYTPARGTKKSEIHELEKYVEQMEYDVYGFPRESLVLFMDASHEARKEIHEAKNRLADLHEADGNYLEQVREVALARCDRDFRWMKKSMEPSLRAKGSEGGRAHRPMLLAPTGWSLLSRTRRWNT